MSSEVTEPQADIPASAEQEPEPTPESVPETHDPALEGETAKADDAAAGPQAKPSPPSQPSTSAVMPPRIFVVALTYLVVLIALFIVYVSWSSFRSHVPTSFGQLPVGIVWFAATGAVIASLYGIFVHNKTWNSSYNYWHYCRPLFGAVTGSVGALIYLVLLNLGSKSAVKIDSSTFYVVAFVFGFADKSFMQMLQNVTKVIIKPGAQTSPVNPNGPPNDGGNTSDNG